MKYYSEILNKNFDKVEDLEKAEKEHAEAEQRKADAKALVAKESEKVQDAFKARNAARRAYNEKLIELRKAYNEAVKQAEKEFTDGLKEVTEAKDKAEVDYDEKLRAFQNAHPEGYRICLKDGDNVITMSSSPAEFRRNLNKEFDDMLDLFSNLIKRF